MFDDIYIVQLRKKSEVILSKMSEGHPLSNEEMNTLILYGLNNHYHDMEGQLLAEIKNSVNETRLLRVDMDKRFEQSREEMDKRFEQVDKRFEQSREEMDKRFEQVDKRFEHIYIFLYWIFGAVLGGMTIGFTALGFFLK